MIRTPRSAGVACLEIQISLVVLGIALAGICPLVVMQQKLLRRIESTQIGTGNPQIVRGQRIIDGEPYATEGNLGSAPITVLQPSADLWSRRLATAASFQNNVKAQPSLPLLTEATLDDDGAIFSGPWAVQNVADANGGSYHLLMPGNPTATVSWSFGSIVPGTYRILISWPTAMPIPEDAELTFTDAAMMVVTVPVVALPQVAGGPWRDLGNQWLGSALTIRLAGSNIGQVVADTVRIGSRNSVTISSLAATDPSPTNLGLARRAQVTPKP
jgi:hypothetical protein